MRSRPAPFALATLALLAACEINPSRDATADTAGDTTRLATDSLASRATGGDTTGAAGDSALLELYPASPRRGGVVFARVLGAAGGSTTPRCSWKGDALPCHAHGADVVALVPLPADEPGGAFPIAIEAAGRRWTRSVSVAEHDFGRELVFLGDSGWKLATDGATISRDARAIRGILRGGSPDRRWQGRWRQPVSGGAKSAGYGVERFYHRASDSARAISIPAGARSRGSFGGDTVGTAARGEAPAWRHAGVDYAVPRRTAVLAPAAGIVAAVGDYGLTGRTLLVDHGQGVFSAYFHLDTALVRQGDLVEAGKAIARVGSTGLSTGPHLHHGIYLHGRDVDPAAWRDMPGWLTAADSTAARR